MFPFFFNFHQNIVSHFNPVAETKLCVLHSHAIYNCPINRTLEIGLCPNVVLPPSNTQRSMLDYVVAVSGLIGFVLRYL